MPARAILIAIDSIGIDPLGHDRAESVYSQSEFLFPKGKRGDLLELPDAPVAGALVETDVTGNRESGAIECAVTYTSIFTGADALARHGLVHGLGLNDAALEQMVEESNLFRLFPDACLANAILPLHLPFLGGSYVEDLVPACSREQMESAARFDGEPVRLLGKQKHGFAELFTLAEINQNIFVHAAREAGVRLCTYDDVARGAALTSTLTHELERRFDLAPLGVGPLPPRTESEAATILHSLAEQHSFVFYKYQLADLVSHSGRLDLAREVFRTIEKFIGELLQRIDPQNTLVIVTSDHGHLEQVDYHQGHPKTNVPTWCFGAGALHLADRLRRPQDIFALLAELSKTSDRLAYRKLP